MILGEVYDEVMPELEHGFRVLERVVPQPQWVEGRLRYVEKELSQLIVQKLARTISGLHSLFLLALHGLHQEQGAIQRILDDFGEDVQFLALGHIHEWTDKHEQYVRDFWLRETDPGVTEKRGMVKRQHIRAFVIKHSPIDNTSKANDVGRTLQKSYSGYVHGASENIIDMAAGDPPRFRVGPDQTHPFRNDYLRDGFNYFYRAIGTFNFACHLFGATQLAARQYAFLKSFEDRYEYVLQIKGLRV